MVMQQGDNADVKPARPPLVLAVKPFFKHRFGMF